MSTFQPKTFVCRPRQVEAAVVPDPALGPIAIAEILAVAAWCGGVAKDCAVSGKIIEVEGLCETETAKPGDIIGMHKMNDGKHFFEVFDADQFHMEFHDPHMSGPEGMQVQ